MNDNTTDINDFLSVFYIPSCIPYPYLSNLGTDTGKNDICENVQKRHQIRKIIVEFIILEIF